MSTPPGRWSRVTVYPDKWVDPAEDPRNTEAVSPHGELAPLPDHLSDHRRTLLMKCDGPAGLPRGRVDGRVGQ